MRTLYLLRHSLNAANEANIYCGSTDLPLSPAGRALALSLRESRPLPQADAYITSGMLRANETLSLLTGRTPDVEIPDLCEIDFGAFEMRAYDDLQGDADFIRWVSDDTGDIPCPGGESENAFRDRALRGGEALLAVAVDAALCVCHGGTISTLMHAWFPAESKHFYQWQPDACRGYRIELTSGRPTRFEEI